MFEKTKILIKKFKKENLVINNYQSQLERITNVKMAILKLWYIMMQTKKKFLQILK